MNHYIVLEDPTPTDALHDSTWVIGPIDFPPMWKPPKPAVYQRKRDTLLPIEERFVYRESKFNPDDYEPQVTHHFENTHRVRLVKFTQRVPTASP